MNLASSKKKTIGFWRKKGNEYKETILIPLTKNEPSTQKFYGLIKVCNPHNEIHTDTIKWTFFEQSNL